MVGQTQVRNGQLVPGPGVKRSTELHLARTVDPQKRDSFTKHQDVIVNGLIPK